LSVIGKGKQETTTVLYVTMFANSVIVLD